MIKTIDLQKIFKTEEVETWALNNVSIEVKQGEFVAIMGPSGCGSQHCSTFWGYSIARQEGERLPEWNGSLPVYRVATYQSSQRCDRVCVSEL